MSEENEEFHSNEVKNVQMTKERSPRVDLLTAGGISSLAGINYKIRRSGVGE